MSVDQPTPRIYVASLAAYNSGELHGTWIDACLGEVEVMHQIRRMLGTSPVGPAEEWAIHDYEGFGPIRLDEYETIGHVCRIAEGIANHGIAFAVWASLLNPAEWSDQLDEFEDHFEGVYDSYRDFGEQLLEMFDVDLDTFDLPEVIRPHITIDLEAIGRSWADTAQYSWFDGRLYVFFD